MQQNESVAGTVNIDVEHGSSHADGRGRRVDRVGVLFLRTGYEAECAFGKVDTDRRNASRFADHELVELQARIGPERELRLIIELEFRLGFVAGFQILVCDALFRLR